MGALSALIVNVDLNSFICSSSLSLAEDLLLALSEEARLFTGEGLLDLSLEYLLLDDSFLYELIASSGVGGGGVGGLEYLGEGGRRISPRKKIEAGCLLGPAIALAPPPEETFEWNPLIRSLGSERSPLGPVGGVFPLGKKGVVGDRIAPPPFTNLVEGELTMEGERAGKPKDTFSCDRFI